MVFLATQEHLENALELLELFEKLMIVQHSGLSCFYFKYCYMARHGLNETDSNFYFLSLSLPVSHSQALSQAM